MAMHHRQTQTRGAHKRPQPDDNNDPSSHTGPPAWWTDDVERLSKMLPGPSSSSSQHNERSHNLYQSWTHSSRSPVGSHGYKIVVGDCSPPTVVDTHQDKTFTLARKIRIRPPAYMRQRFQRAFSMCDRAWNYAHDMLTEMGWFGRSVPSKLGKWLANQVVTKEKKRPIKPTEQTYASSRGWTAGINPLHQSDPSFFDSSLCPPDMKRAAVHKLCAAINSTLALKEANRMKAATKTGAPRMKRHKPDTEVPMDRLVVEKREPNTGGGDRSFHIDPYGLSKREPFRRPSGCLGRDRVGFNFAPTWLQMPTSRKRKQVSYRDMEPIRPFSNRRIRLPDGRRVNRELHRLTQLMDGGRSFCRRQATLKYERPGRYYLIIPFERLPRQRPRSTFGPAVKAIALDPGVRTFQTGYDLLGRCVEMGKDVARRPTRSNKRGQDGGTGRILSHLKRIDRVVSTPADTATSKKERRRRRNKALRMRNKARNWVEEAQRKTAKWLTERYDHVLVPYSRVSGMVKRRTERKLTRDGVRQMLGWGHYRFRMRLVEKGRLNGCRVHQVSEHYTTKTCSYCGTFWHEIGASKVFRCQNNRCGMVCDRDLNAARNIMQMNAAKCLGRLEPILIPLYNDNNNKTTPVRRGR